MRARGTAEGAVGDRLRRAADQSECRPRRGTRPARARAGDRAGPVPDETAREFGTVFLPACSSFEKEGTFMNAERRIQRVRGALAPGRRVEARLADHLRDRARDGRQWIRLRESGRDLERGARALRRGARDDVRADSMRAASSGRARARSTPARRSCIATRSRSGHAPRCSPSSITATPEVVTAEHPLLLITGRSLYQFNAGTMTGRTLNNELRSCDVLDISPVDAGRLRLGDGQMVRVTSRYGSATLSIRVNTTVKLLGSSSQPFRRRASSSTRSRVHTVMPASARPSTKVTAVQTR